MPNTNSAKKRLRQNEARRLENRSISSAMKTQMKKVEAAAADGDVEKAEQEYRQAAKKLDRAGARNIIHRNAAARQKSRLQRVIKRAKQGSSN